MGDAGTMGTGRSLDIDLLRSFVLIVEERSFTRAAERVGRTQSAVSLQVQRLESLVGHRLIERGKGAGIRLTTQGDYLFERAGELLSLNDDILGLMGAGSLKRERNPSDGSTGLDLPSLAVLPFRNARDEPKDFLAAGVVDSVIARLSRISWLVVAGTGSTGGRNERDDVRRVGRELNVRYVLQGSVRQAGRRVRISAQLLEAETRRHCWTADCDGVADDLFDFADQIADQIVGVLEPGLRRIETERAQRRPTDSLDAFGLYLRAFPLVEAQMPGKASQALPLLRRALELDPDYASAHALLAWCHELRFARGGYGTDDRESALVHAKTVLDGDTDDGTAVVIAAFVMNLLAKEDEVALSTMERGLSMNPSSAIALHLCAQANALAGRRRSAVSLADQALRLSPTDGLSFQAHMALGETALAEERFTDAASCFARAARSKPNFSTAYIYQAIALAQAGRASHASDRLARGYELEPGFSPRAFFEHDLNDSLRASLVAGAGRLGLAP
jgi:TolB-like protein/Flp pilus assembly protein TadD